MNAMDARPVGGSQDEALLAAVRKEVVEPCDLRRWFIAHRNRLVAAAPQDPASAVEAAQLASQVRIDEAHRSSELLGIFWTAQQVIVVRQEDEELDLQIELFLRAPQDAEDDLAPARVGFETQECPERPRGDLDETSRFEIP